MFQMQVLKWLYWFLFQWLSFLQEFLLMSMFLMTATRSNPHFLLIQSMLAV